jgi:hypothetical protein
VGRVAGGGGLLRELLADGGGARGRLGGELLADVETGERGADEADTDDQMFFVHLGKG